MVEDYWITYCGNQINQPAELAFSGDQIDTIDLKKSVSSFEVEQVDEVHEDNIKIKRRDRAFTKPLNRKKQTAAGT